MDFIVIALTAAFASVLSLFSGFGLGTLLLPAFAFFVPLEMAVAATAIVHGANGALKVWLLGRHTDREVFIRFGLPAIGAAMVGAGVLAALSHGPPLASYVVLNVPATVTPVKLVMGTLMFGFAVVELHPRWSAHQFDRRYLSRGGILSGFFGGVSGHQGALRSAFLTKAGLTPEGFVGTSAALGLAVDITRLAVYGATAKASADFWRDTHTVWLVVVGVLAAFPGVAIGQRLVKKVTMRSIQRITGGLLVLIACGLCFGLV